MVTRIALLLATLAGGIGALSTLPERVSADALSVLDVGQGDSIVVDGGMPVMIDTGNPGSRALEQFGKPVAALVLTHLHEDHAGDATEVLRSRPAAVFWNGRTDGSLYEEIAAEAGRQGVPLVALVPGDLLHAGSATLRVIGPAAGYLSSHDLNDGSLVVMASLPGFDALLTGDATLEAEVALDPALLDADVLKVGHHGSKGSTGDALLQAVTPEVAIVSAGEGNRYGHPAPEALARLQATGVRLFRTDLDGTVTMRAPGGILEVSSASGP